MPLVIDLAAAARRLSDDEFLPWAQDQTVFLSSVMAELAAERQAVANALEGLGVNVRWFEDFGGRDDNASDAYLGEVRSATVYLGLLGDDYGPMLTYGEYKGFSATHAEYLEARRNGKRISFWERRPSDAREGHARKFLDEVWLSNVTGRFAGEEDLPRNVEKRLREIAAEDLSPWVKLGDVIVRASRVQASGDEFNVLARVHDPGVLRVLSEMVGSRHTWSRNNIPITSANRSGTGRVERFAEANTSAAFTDVELTAKVDWSASLGMDAGTTGYSADDLTEVGMRVGLLGEPMPSQLGQMGFLVPAEDPLAELETLHIPEGAVQPLARLLVVEALVGSARASAVEHFALGPKDAHQRHLELSWWEPRRYSNREPALRAISGVRRWP